MPLLLGRGVESPFQRAGPMQDEPEPSAHLPGDRLDSWKSIAGYLRRDVRTVQRWERTDRLPIHRHPSKIGGVYAYKGDLDAWWRRAKSEADAAPRSRWAAAIVAAACATAAVLGIAYLAGRVRQTPMLPTSIAPEARILAGTWTAKTPLVHPLHNAGVLAHDGLVW